MGVADLEPCQSRVTVRARNIIGHIVGSGTELAGVTVTDPSVTSAGWYDIQTYGDSSLSADYNFVCGSNYVAKLAAPPSDFQHWGSNGYETHGINGGNPLFNSEANGDFRLQAGSPLIGAALNLSSMFTGDAAGSGRALSGAWDIGPYRSAGAGGGVNRPAPPSRLRIGP